MAKWTEEEIEVLKMNITVEEMKIFLPGRDRKSIIRKMRSLKLEEIPIKNKIWTEEELKIVEKDLGLNELDKLLPNRDKKSIVDKRANLGIGKGEKIRKWTEEEIKILKEEYAFETIHELIKKLNRSGSSIRSKANSLKLEKKVIFKK